MSLPLPGSAPEEERGSPDALALAGVRYAHDLAESVPVVRFTSEETEERRYLVTVVEHARMARPNVAVRWGLLGLGLGLGVHWLSRLWGRS